MIVPAVMLLFWCVSSALDKKYVALSDGHFGDSSACPSSKDVSATVGTDWFRHQIWSDRACLSGCTLPAHKRFGLPRCVVRRSTGLLNQALQQCLRQVDHDLMSRMQKNKGSSILKYCNNFLNLEFVLPDCTEFSERVPRIVHTISADEIDEIYPFHVRMAIEQDIGFVHHHVSDASALVYIRDRCSSTLAEVYRCIKPRAFRADLFRFCALYAEGGVYLDADLVPLVPIRDLYSPCSSFTLGYDQAQGTIDIEHIGMQMKILAGVPGNDISACMMERIAENVRERKNFKTPLEFSGPQLLRTCYLKYPKDVAVTYMDTRGAAWPYSGLRRREKILAYEKPNISRHFKEIFQRDSSEEYNDMVKRKDLYNSNCVV